MSEATHTGSNAAADLKPAAAPVTPPAAGVVAPAVQATPAPIAQPEVINTTKVPTRKLVEDADSELPDTDILEFKPSAFKARMERHAASHLKKELGVDNIEAVRERLAKAEQYEKQQEEIRLANLSEVERLKEINGKLESERDQLRSTHQSYLEQQELTAVTNEIRDIGVKYVLPKYLKYATEDLREALAKTPSEQYEKDPEAFVQGWFEKYASENPQLSVPQAAPPAPPAAPQATLQQPPQLVVGITNGPNATPPGERANVPLNKTPSPGQPNSMNDAEFREYKRLKGYV